MSFSSTARESLARPQFVDKLKNITVKQGTLVELAVKAMGNPLPDIVWLKNSDIISPHKHPHIRYVSSILAVDDFLICGNCFVKL